MPNGMTSSYPPSMSATSPQFSYAGNNQQLTPPSLQSTSPMTNADIGSAMGTGNRNGYVDASFEADLVSAAACYYGTVTSGPASFSGLPTSSCDMSTSGGVSYSGYMPVYGGATNYYHQLSIGSAGAGAKSQRKSAGGRDDKFCGVCGDRALSYNFDAISCESCKAFFRRNAPKGLENFKCPYDERCRMDVSNRRFCKRCRLNKCFQIGMRKEYILSEEEKAQKRQKIEANRLLRLKAENHRKQSVPADAGSGTRTSSQSISGSNLSFIDYDEPSPPHIPPDTAFAGSVMSGGAEVTSQTVALQPEDAREIDELLTAYHLSVESQQRSYVIGYNLDGPCDNGRSFSSFASVSGDGIDGRGSLLEANWYACARSMDTFGGRTDCGAASSIRSASKPAPRVSGGSAQNLADLVNIAELSMRRVIAMTKQIASFRQLPQPDQIRLLKSGSIELLILRSVLTYDADKQHFLDPGDDEFASAMDIDELRRAEEHFDGARSTGLFDDHMRFVRSLAVDLRADETTLVLLLVVSLFSPDRENLVSRDFVADEQERYCLLLKRYLESRHAAPSARVMFARLVTKLVEIRTLSEELSLALTKLNPDGIQPLMKEVLDLRSPQGPTTTSMDPFGGATGALVAGI